MELCRHLLIECLSKFNIVRSILMSMLLNKLYYICSSDFTFELIIFFSVLGESWISLNTFFFHQLCTNFVCRSMLFSGLCWSHFTCYSSIIYFSFSCLQLQTPLHYAASLNRVEIIKYLLDWQRPGKAELEAKDAVSNEFINIVSKNITRSTPVWILISLILLQYGETPLHVASKNGCTESVKMLLNYGANVGARTNVLVSLSFSPLLFFIATCIKISSKLDIRIAELDDSITSCCWLCTAVWRQLNGENIVGVRR